MAYPMAPNRSNDWNSMHKVRGLSANERYARRCAARWARVAMGAEDRAVHGLLNSGAISEVEWGVRLDAIEARRRRLLGAAERGEFPAPGGFTMMTDTSPDMETAALAQVVDWEDARTERQAA